MTSELQSQPKPHDREPGGRQASATVSQTGVAVAGVGLLGNGLWRTEVADLLSRPPARTLGAAAVLGLQQTHGNRHVARLLADQRGAGPSSRQAAVRRSPTPIVGDSAADPGEATADETWAVEPWPAVRRATGAAGDGDGDDPRAIQAALGPGEPLATNVRGSMETAFGESFAHVRTHTDGTAAAMSAGLNARAFAVGEHVAFGAGEYQPETPIGDALIAHELAHVAQQNGAMAGPLTKAEGEDSALEADADRAAFGAVGALWGRATGAIASVARNVGPSLRSGLRLQRCSGGSASPRVTPERLEFVGSHPMSPNHGDPKVNPVWTPASTDHAVAFSKDGRPAVNARFRVDNLPAAGDAGTDAGDAADAGPPAPGGVSVRVKEGGNIRGTQTGITASGGLASVNNLVLTGLTDSNGVRQSTYSLEWEFSTDGSTWTPAATTGPHPVYWLYGPPLVSPAANFAIAKATRYAAGASSAPAIAVAIRSGLRRMDGMAYKPDDPTNADPLTVYDDAVGICTDYGNLLTLLALSVGLRANAVLFFGGFTTLGKNVWVQLGGGLTLINVKGAPDFTKTFAPVSPTGWAFTFHAISRIEGVLQDAALDTEGIDAQAAHQGLIIRLFEMNPIALPPAKVGRPYSQAIPRKDHTVEVVIHDGGQQLTGADFASLDLPIPAGATSPVEVPVLWRLPTGPLPPGLLLSPAGVIVGTPTRAGTSRVSVETSAAGVSNTAAFELKVERAPRRRRSP